ncbi:beta family protein [Nitrosophilus kaiyonis]|uniref:beta family protein n=1 Tax=Nitrosophilus kaiyonis TaxID=2930200 RepID=UPI0024928066|nr:hypothetical protein [Nitrosophilus kaiyonis]
MYYPILKNKTNEMLALENVKSHNFIPIIELVSANRMKYDEAKKIFEKIKHENTIMIDIPNYMNNKVIDKYDLIDPRNRIDFFVNFKKEYNNNMIPILSFYYTDNMKKSIKDNITVLNGLLNEFDEIGIRILTDKTFKKDDIEILENIDIFMNGILKKIYIILEFSQSTVNELKYFFDNFEIDKFKKVIVTGEIHTADSFLENDELQCTLFKNKLLDLVHLLKEKYSSKQIEYGDYTVVDKINQFEDEVREGPVFYVPFLRWTTKHGDICKYTAQTVGNMEQYKDLCKLIIKHPDFDQNHCSTCKDIYTLANGGDINYKAGGTWKHRMITHHITTMADYLD